MSELHSHDGEVGAPAPSRWESPRSDTRGGWSSVPRRAHTSFSGSLSLSGFFSPYLFFKVSRPWSREGGTYVSEMSVKCRVPSPRLCIVPYGSLRQKGTVDGRLYFRGQSKSRYSSAPGGFGRGAEKDDIDVFCRYSNQRAFS